MAAGNRETTALAVVQIRQLGGAFADVSPSDGAVRPVTDPFHVFGLGMLFVPELEGPVRAGLAALESALTRLSSGHRLPNFCGEHQRSNDGYDDARLERLRAIKRARDPHGVIRSNKPVLASDPGSDRQAAATLSRVSAAPWRALAALRAWDTIRAWAARRTRGPPLTMP